MSPVNGGMTLRVSEKQERKIIPDSDYLLEVLPSSAVAHSGELNVGPVARVEIIGQSPALS